MSDRITILATLESKISKKVALWVLLSIVAIESVILVPSYLRREDELLHQLEVVGRTAIITAFTNPDNRVNEHKIAHASGILSFSNAIGLAVIENGRKIIALGIEPDVAPQALAMDAVFRQRSADGLTYNLGWRLKSTDGVHRSAFIRVDAQHVQGELQMFVLRIFGLVLIISVFVTGITMLALWPIVLRPVLNLKAHFSQQDGPESRPDLSDKELQRSDEVGDLYRAFQALSDRASEMFRALYSDRENLELQVSERTRELENLNEQLTKQISLANQAESRFRSFTQSAADWYFEMDENLRFSFFSERFTDVTGVDTERLLGLTRRETGIPNVDPASWEDHLDRLDRHQSFRNFIHPREHDGQTTWVSINGEPVFDESGKFQGYRGTGTDITERVLAEESLAQIEGRLRAFIDHSPSAILIKDIDGRCLEANKAWHQWFNPMDEDVAGKLVSNFYFGDHAEDVRKQDIEVISTLKTVEREIETPLPDGRVLTTLMQKFPLLDANGKIVAIGGMNTDVTELKTAENRYRDLIEMSPDAIFIHRDRVIVYANKRANELY